MTLETPDLKPPGKSYYNLGNSQFKDGEMVQKVDTNKTIDLWQQALQSYESALKLRDSADTRHNHEIVKEKLEQLKKQQQQHQQQQQQNNQSQPQQDPSAKNSQQVQSKDNPQQKNQPNQQNQPNPKQRSESAIVATATSFAIPTTIGQ